MRRRLKVYCPDKRWVNPDPAKYLITTELSPDTVYLDMGGCQSQTRWEMFNKGMILAFSEIALGLIYQVWILGKAKPNSRDN